MIDAVVKIRIADAFDFLADHVGVSTYLPREAIERGC